MLNQLDRRKVDWGDSEIKNRFCPVCNSSSHCYFETRPDGLRVNTCKNCSLLYISPSPTEESLDKLYKNYHLNYFSSNIRTNKLSINNYHREALEYIEQKDPRITYLIKVMENRRNINILDFGCGTGKFLYAAKTLGANVFGIEYDLNAVRMCHTVGLDRVLHGDAQAINKISEPIDLVVLNDVIEHPLEITPIIENLINIMNDGGEILIWTPNGDWVFHDQEHITLRIDLEHMQYITAKALAYICNSNDLVIVHYETLGFPTKSNFLEIKKKGILHKGLYFLRRTLNKTIIGSFLKKIRVSLLGQELYPRNGSYHLFTVLRKINHGKNKNHENTTETI